MVKVGDKIYPVKHTLSPESGDQLGLAQVQSESGISIDRYLPFVTITQVPDPSATENSNGDGGVAVNFNLESRFFNVSETLDSQNKASLEMGPAVLKLFVDTQTKATQAPAKRPATTHSVLAVLDAESGKALRKISLDEFKKGPVSVKNIRISLVKVFNQAAVEGGKLTERGQPGANPALELVVESGQASQREVSFSKFADFSLNPKGNFGLKFQYFPSNDVVPSAEPGVPPPAGSGHNVIEFHVDRTHLDAVHVQLFKNGEAVLTKKAKAGETIQSPWMGMKITINSIGPSGKMIDQIRSAEMQPRMPLPPSAIFVRPDQGEGTWLVEGDARTFASQGREIEVYYGPGAVQLPFDVTLDQFRKIDYPGTETPMSFESTIRLSKGGEARRIQMNEPLNHDGYLLYQSSYEQGPGMPTASIFSVNRDPGRFIKYVGAIILMIGIVLFTLMRSKWYLNLRKKQKMKTASTLVLLIFGLISLLVPSHNAQAASNQDDFVSLARHIDTSEIEKLPIQSHGRVKPFESFARESNLFLTGRYSQWGLTPSQFYLGLVISNAGQDLEIVNIRDPELRYQLGLPKTRRNFSLKEIINTNLEAMAQPLMKKQSENEKSLTPAEKNVIEAIEQSYLLQDLISGAPLERSAILNVQKAASADPSGEVVLEKLRHYLAALKANDAQVAQIAVTELVAASKSQAMPEMFRPQLNKLGLEVFYTRLRPFFWVGILYMLLGLLLASQMLQTKLSRGKVFGLIALPFALHAAGFAMRVYITGFAPVTNMYGTMVWMAFGVVLFSSLLFGIYQQYVVYGLLLIGASVTLLLTESMPLILSSDMDPIVAVLSNNFWLTIHVLTISISYAAFTISMLIGNAASIRLLLKKASKEELANLAHLAYRAIQLGVFLLTTGIILGGWWADYSWGRFWGWDPKETWALIADLGFLAILHAKYVKWIDSSALLFAAPLAYLLVIMAWYGVNFILAAGLHSYGFSSGGTTVVVTFVSLQLVLSAAAWYSRSRQRA